jgi:hypothetical protein
VSGSIDVEAKLHGILKSYDRIGFGRRGVLDAEQEILRLASGLTDVDHARLREAVVSWIEGVTAERVSARLHYNMPEHVQALALNLCASVPIPESLPLLRRLQGEGAFAAPEEATCRAALDEALKRLARRPSLP